jgi:hypothetical protein
MSFAGTPSEHDANVREFRSMALFELQAAETHSMLVGLDRGACHRLLHHLTEGYMRMGQVGVEGQQGAQRNEHQDAFKHFRNRFKKLRDSYEERCAIPE